MNVLKYLDDNHQVVYDKIEDKIVLEDVDLNEWGAGVLLSVVITLFCVVDFLGGTFHLIHLFLPLGFWFLTGLGYGLNKYILSRSVDYANTNIGPPHEVIDDFVRWKEGDWIETDHFKGDYYGIDKKQRIVLQWGKDNFSCLPTGYLDCSTKVQNKTLYRRKKEQADNRIKNEANEETQYDKLLEEFREEYDRLEQ